MTSRSKDQDDVATISILVDLSLVIPILVTVESKWDGASIVIVLIAIISNKTSSLTTLTVL